MKRIHKQMMEQDMLELLLVDLIKLEYCKEQAREQYGITLSRIIEVEEVRKQRQRVEALMDEIVEYKIQTAIPADRGFYVLWQRLRNKGDKHVEN